MLEIEKGGRNCGLRVSSSLQKLKVFEAISSMTPFFQLVRFAINSEHATRVAYFPKPGV